MSVNLNVPRKTKLFTHNYQLIKVELENKNIPTHPNKPHISSNHFKD